MQPGHGEEEDGVGVAAASSVLAHTLVRLQRLSTRDEEDLEWQTGVGGESWGNPITSFSLVGEGENKIRIICKNKIGSLDIRSWNARISKKKRGKNIAK